MIPFDEALRIALESARRLPTERVDLKDALGRVLAEEVTADMSMPPFDKSMVDGYACRKADLPGPLTVIETVPAGRIPERALAQGSCAKIMTGAMVPEGADCVFMVEHSETAVNGRVRYTHNDAPGNITPAGKHLVRGDVLLRRGQWISPQDIAVLATAGVARPLVSVRPQAGVVATGDELVEPDEKPALSQIRNSNAFQLVAQVEAMGCVAQYVGIARDSEASLRETVGRGLEENDVLLLSGGVSMGDFDLVPGILKEFGIEIQFDKVAIQPGKPTVFGFSDNVFCFGLPGNPVSTFVIFEILVKPFLLRMMGHDYRPPQIRMPLGESFKRQSGTRKAWVPVVLGDDGTARRVNYHGSAHINALCAADGFVPFEQGVTEMSAGEIVPVRLLRT